MNEILSQFGRSRAAKLFAAAMIFIGFVAFVRYSGELAYGFGQVVGSH